ncbi:hypothetical protein DW352_22945 [Pseudolabrys taiwanensis]|uniref:Uncharacterized protein n=1 Tax=Pseudolabrys taiwanensis TaxID=331696 RepID=A0A346A1S7_9HYPH|nr:hypothetical protein [Pseudolabrys taiwanensis]AXK83124.1 hypothetical protein DW352_22945 [Pseudolabrys taiwanensis]
MKRALTIGIVGAALAATFCGVTAYGEEPSSMQVAQAADAYAPRYDFGPRIIHVPQPDEEDAAYVPNGRAMPDEDDDADAPPPPPRRQSGPRPRLQQSSAPPSAPRRKPYTVATPEPSAPVKRRTVLSAPLHDGPTPIRPTPRYVKETGAKFAPSPPPGYTPPSNVPAEAAAVPPEPAPDVAPRSAAPQSSVPPNDTPASE